MTVDNSEIVLLFRIKHVSLYHGNCSVGLQQKAVTMLKLTDWCEY